MTTPSEDVGFARRVRDAMCDVAQLLDAAKQEWELLGDWSKWDADTRQKVTAVLVECEKEIGRKPAPSEDLVEQTARVIHATASPIINDEEAKAVARAVLASTPVRQYFRDLDHADEGKPAQVEKVTPPEAQWQPIETAPRDGTHILIAFGEDGVCSATYSADDADAWPWKFVDQQGVGRPIFNGARDDKYGPTDWQPLPASPTTHSSLTADAAGLRVGVSREPNLSESVSQTERIQKLEAALLELVRCVIEGKPLDVAIESARAALEGRP